MRLTHRTCCALLGAIALLPLAACDLLTTQATTGRGEPAASKAGTGGFDCPLTHANGSRPPGETVVSEDYYGNGQLWTVLPPGGLLAIEPDLDGALSRKFPWWRAAGTLQIEGRRLDAAAPPLRAHIPEGYGDSGFQATGLYFPTEGCWEVTGRAGPGTLTFVVAVQRVGN